LIALSSRARRGICSTVVALLTGATTLYAQAGAVRGRVTDATSGRALPYSAVAASGVERFSDDSGRFTLTGLRGDRVPIRVRHVGYTPFDTVLSIDPARDVDLRIALTPIAMTLSAVRVEAAARCTSPGAPRGAVDTALATAFHQLEQNAEQYRLLTQRYPFESMVRQQFWFDAAAGPAEPTERVALVRSDARDLYEPGEAIVSRGLRRAVVIPTLAVFTEPKFVEAHCFRSGGIDTVDGQRLLRIDFQAAERIKGPDLDGSMYLDPASFIIRRSRIAVSHLTNDLSEFDSITVESRFEEVLPGVPIVGEADGRSHYVMPRETRTGIRARAYVEHQRDVQITFLRGRPGAENDPSRPHPRGNVWRLDRIIGLFDADTGEPVAGATLADSASGTSVTTSTTGTASLAFVLASRAVVQVLAPGYEPMRLDVRLSFADATPMTVVLRRAKPRRGD